MAESLTFLWNIRTKVRVRGDYVVTGSAEELEIIRMAQLQAAQYQIFVLWFREGPLNQAPAILPLHKIFKSLPNWK